MKICYFGTYDRNYSRNQIILEGLKRNNIQVVEVSASLEQTRLYSKKHIGILAISYRLIRKLKFLPVWIKNIQQIKKCDVIFVPYPGHLDVPIAYITAKLLRKPLLFDPTFSLFQVLTSDFKIADKDAILSHIIKRAEEIIFSLPDIILADTKLQKKYYNSELGVPLGKIAILPIGADDRIYKYSKRKFTQNSLNVVYYGLYNPLHGVEYIIKAADICKNDKMIQFIMVGNGQTYSDNLKLAQKYKLTNIKFFPDMTEKNAMSTLSQADIFLGFFQQSPTVYRSIPNKVIQGMAMGKAVLTADTPAIRSVFTPMENIYLVKAADEYAIASAITKLKNNPTLRRKIAHNGYNLFVRNFTPKAIGEKLSLTIKNALGTKITVSEKPILTKSV